MTTRHPDATAFREAGQLSLFVFIDALGWRIFQRHRDLLLANELPVTSPLETVLGYSCSCDPTILTGKPPQEHGHFAFYRFLPNGSPFAALRAFRWLPKQIADRGRVRHHLSKVIAKAYGYTGYFQLYNMAFDRLPLMDYSEKRDLYRPGGIISGAPTLFDRLHNAGVPHHVSDWRASEVANLATLSAEITKGKVRCAYLYLAGLDGTLHQDGTHAASITDHIRWYDEQLRAVLALARERYDQVSMCLFSDHGMTDVQSTCDLSGLVGSVANKAGLRHGVDYGVVYDSTMARFWFMSTAAETAIRGALKACDQGRALTDEQLSSYGCLFPDREYGELFFLLHPGVLLCPSDMGARPIRGMHGYSPEHEDSTAFFAATHDCVAPKRLEDLCGFMLETAGVSDMRQLKREATCA